MFQNISKIGQNETKSRYFIFSMMCYDNSNAVHVLQCRNFVANDRNISVHNMFQPNGKGFSIYLRYLNDSGNCR